MQTCCVHRSYGRAVTGEKRRLEGIFDAQKKYPNISLQKCDALRPCCTTCKVAGKEGSCQYNEEQTFAHTLLERTQALEQRLAQFESAAMDPSRLSIDKPCDWDSATFPLPPMDVSLAQLTPGAFTANSRMIDAGTSALTPSTSTSSPSNSATSPSINESASPPANETTTCAGASQCRPLEDPEAYKCSAADIITALLGPTEHAVTHDGIGLLSRMPEL
jgi:hypothetical protein